MRKKLYFLTAVCFVLSLSIGCKEDREEPVEPTNLTVDKASFTVDADVSKQSFVVITNKDWELKTESGWLTCTPVSGKANDRLSVEITVSANTESKERKGVITITAEEKSVQVEVTQRGKPDEPSIPGIEIPDENFKKYLLALFDTNKDGKISTEEAGVVTYMDCSNKAIASMVGLEHFVRLDTLLCNDNQITALNLSKNVRLALLNCDNNAISSLDVSKNIELVHLTCRSNQMTTLNVSENIKLKMLDCTTNKLPTLNVDKLVAIELLRCFDNEIDALDISKCAALITLDCKNNHLTALVSNNAALTTIDCSNNQLTTLDVSKNAALKTLYCPDNHLTALVSANEALTSIDCSNNKLTTLDVSKNAALITLNCSYNQLTALVSDNKALTSIDCSNNQLQTFDISGNTALITLNCSSNQLTQLDISNNKALKTLLCPDNKLTVLDVRNNLALEKLDCRNNETLAKILLAEDQVIPELLYDSDTTQLEYPEKEPEKTFITIPDANLKAYLVANFDKDKDGEISEEEALNIKDIRCWQMGIASMTGIEYFPNLEILYCGSNKLTSLDVTKNLKLRELSCSENDLKTIDVSKNTALTHLLIINCGLSELGVKANKELKELNCSSNKLTTLEVSVNTKLEQLYCQRNNLSFLDLRKNWAIYTLNCRENPRLTTVYLEHGHLISSLFYDNPPTSIIYAAYISIKDEAFLNFLLNNYDTDGDGQISDLEIKSIKEMDCSNQGIVMMDEIYLFANLTSLKCSGNQLTTLNVTTLTQLVTLVCDNNILTRLDISRNTRLISLDCSHNHISLLTAGTGMELKTLDCSDNWFSGLPFNQLPKLETLYCQNNDFWAWIDVSNNLMLSTLNCKNNPFLLRILVRPGQTIANVIKDDQTTIIVIGEDQLAIPIPDRKFKDYLVAHFDTNNDGEISFAEALLVTDIFCESLGIESLSGIENFTNLTSLKCGDNQISFLPVAGLTKLVWLDCSTNELTSLEVSTLENLTNLYCRNNRLTSLLVHRNAELVTLFCDYNQLTSLNVRRNARLQNITCTNNASGFTVYKASSQTSLSITTDGNIVTTDIVGVNILDVIFEDYLITNFDHNGDGSLDVAEQATITTIDCSNMGITTLSGIEHFPNLSTLRCDNNKLTSLNLNGLAKLTIVICNDNKIADIDVAGCTLLRQLYCPGNRLTTLNVTGNTALEMLYCLDNPTLSTVYLSLAFHNASMVTKDSHTTLVFQ